jgi:hypothetical protein
MARKPRELFIAVQVGEVTYLHPTGVTFLGRNTRPYLEGGVEDLAHRVACEGQAYRYQDDYVFPLVTEGGREEIWFRTKGEDFPSGELKLLPASWRKQVGGKRAPGLSRLSIAYYLCQGVKHCLPEGWRELSPALRVLNQQDILAYLTDGEGATLVETSPDASPTLVEGYRAVFRFIDDSQLALTSQGPEVRPEEKGYEIFSYGEKYQSDTLDMHAVRCAGNG